MAPDCILYLLIVSLVLSILTLIASSVCIALVSQSLTPRETASIREELNMLAANQTELFGSLVHMERIITKTKKPRPMTRIDEDTPSSSLDTMTSLSSGADPSPSISRAGSFSHPS
jgi:hypothetical protein